MPVSGPAGTVTLGPRNEAPASRDHLPRSDLLVYLSTVAAGAPRDTFDDDFVSLGRLRANQGSQNYAIPDGVALDRYQSVVIWCRRFAYAFGAAPLR